MGRSARKVEMLDAVLVGLVTASAVATLIHCLAMVRHGQGIDQTETRQQGCSVDLSRIAGGPIAGPSAWENADTGASGQADWVESHLGHAAAGRRCAVGNDRGTAQV